MRPVPRASYICAKVALAFSLIGLLSFIWSLTTDPLHWDSFIPFFLNLFGMTWGIYCIRGYRRQQAALKAGEQPLETTGADEGFLAEVPLLPASMKDPAWAEAAEMAAAKVLTWAQLHRDASGILARFADSNRRSGTEDAERAQVLAKLLTQFPKPIRELSRPDWETRRKDGYEVNRTYYLSDEMHGIRGDQGRANRAAQSFQRYIDGIEKVLPEIQSARCPRIAYQDGRALAQGAFLVNAGTVKRIWELHVPRLMRANTDCPRGHVAVHPLEATGIPGRVRRTCALCEPEVTWTEEV